MLVSEFVDRTQYQPTEKEFAAINEDYSNSPLNKDEFCRKWCKMNPTKAGDLKRKEREQKQKEKEQKRLLKLIGEAKKDAYIMLTTEFQEKLKSISRETKSAASLLRLWSGGVDSEYKNARHGLYEPLRFGAIISELKHQINRGLDSYTKVFFVYNNNLILASPIYGSKDYNKTYLLKIDDVKTMRFAELVVRQCVRHFNYNPNNYLQL